MATVTKKELVDRISDATQIKRVHVKKVVQAFLDSIVVELGKGNRLEFRDFGVFEVKQRAARMAQNPKTLEQVPVPPKRAVKFKAGNLMKSALSSETSPPQLQFNPEDHLPDQASYDAAPASDAQPASPPRPSAPPPPGSANPPAAGPATPDDTEDDPTGF